MVFCNITAGSRFLCFSFLFKRRCISLVQWLGTPELGRPQMSQAGLLHPGAQLGGWRGRKGEGGGRRDLCLPRASASLYLLGLQRTSSSPVTAPAHSPSRGLEREFLTWAKDFLTQLYPSLECPHSAVSRWNQLYGSRQPAGQEVLRCCPLTEMAQSLHCVSSAGEISGAYFFFPFFKPGSGGAGNHLSGSPRTALA